MRTEVFFLFFLSVCTQRNRRACYICQATRSLILGAPRQKPGDVVAPLLHWRSKETGKNSQHRGGSPTGHRFSWCACFVLMKAASTRQRFELLFSKSVCSFKAAQTCCITHSVCPPPVTSASCRWRGSGANRGRKKGYVARSRQN